MSKLPTIRPTVFPSFLTCFENLEDSIKVTILFINGIISLEAKKLLVVDGVQTYFMSSFVGQSNKTRRTKEPKSISNL